MDNFMDKLAQRLNAQDVIRANTQAEAAELKRLRVQLEAYEQCLSEIQEVNGKSDTLAAKAQELLEQSKKQVAHQEELTAKAEELNEQTRKLLEEGIDKLVTMSQQDDGEKEQLMQDMQESLQEHQKALAQQFSEAEDFVHKENVKVYRNVQAVVVDELKAQTEQLFAKQEEQNKKNSNLKQIVIVAAALSGINLVVAVVQILIALGII